MTFSFEMRSGREHNTPDKAMWGFSCTVRAQVEHGNTGMCQIMFNRAGSVEHEVRPLIPKMLFVSVFRNHQRTFLEASPSWQTLHWVCQCWPARCSASYITVQR